MSGFLRLRPLGLTHAKGRDRHGVRRAAASAMLAIAVTTAAPTVGAQVLSGTVRDSASQQPLPNTRVLALDAAGRATASVSTDQQGRFRISPWTSRAMAAAGTVRIRAVRMGFRPREVTVSRASAGAPFDVPLVPFPIVLEEFQVMAATCPKRADRAPALALLRQVRQALFATVLARSQSSATMTRLLYDRTVESRTGRVLASRSGRRSPAPPASRSRRREAPRCSIDRASYVTVSARTGTSAPMRRR